MYIVGLSTTLNIWGGGGYTLPGVLQSGIGEEVTSPCNLQSRIWGEGGAHCQTIYNLEFFRGRYITRQSAISNWCGGSSPDGLQSGIYFGGGVILLGNLQFRIWRGTLPDDLQS